MKQEELNKILVKHKKWLRTNSKVGCVANFHHINLRHVDLSNADLRYADLSYADLRFADLRHADLSYADLRYADLRYADLYYIDLRHADLSHANLRSTDLLYADLRHADLLSADLDYSAFPLWCGGLDVNIDDRQATQILYHLIRNVNYSENISESFKKLCMTESLVNQANKFHKIDECGIIKGIR